MRRRTRERA